jgi:hypothetical protein
MTNLAYFVKDYIEYSQVTGGVWVQYQPGNCSKVQSDGHITFASDCSAEKRCICVKPGSVNNLFRSFTCLIISHTLRLVGIK